MKAARQAALRQQLGLLAKPDIIRPAVSIGLDVMRAAVIAAIDQHVAEPEPAPLVEGDRLRVGRHRCGSSVTRPTLRRLHLDRRRVTAVPSRLSTLLAHRSLSFWPSPTGPTTLPLLDTARHTLRQQESCDGVHRDTHIRPAF